LHKTVQVQAGSEQQVAERQVQNSSAPRCRPSTVQAEGGLHCSRWWQAQAAGGRQPSSPGSAGGRWQAGVVCRKWVQESVQVVVVVELW